LPALDPLSGTMLPPDDIGPSACSRPLMAAAYLARSGIGRLAAGRVDGRLPARPRHLRRERRPAGTLDGKLDVSVSYRDPQRDTGFDPELSS